jgi:hypothetical protein
MTRPTSRQAVAWLLAPALLLAVAGVHAYLVEAKDQTPWEGGGFGMFSTMDKRQARFVRCTLITPERAVPVRVPSHLGTYVERMRARPTELRTRRLADFLARADWVRAEPSAVDTIIGGDGPAGLYRYRPPYEEEGRPEAVVESVRVEIWRMRFRSRPYRLEGGPLVQATAAVPDEGS